LVTECSDSGLAWSLAKMLIQTLHSVIPNSVLLLMISKLSSRVDLIQQFNVKCVKIVTNLASKSESILLLSFIILGSLLEVLQIKKIN